MKLRLGLIKRFLAGGTTLLAVLVIVNVTGGATADAAALSAETPSGQAGSAVQVTGDGFVAGVQVRLCWDNPGCEDLGTAVPQGFILGSFSTQATIPLSADPGTYEIHGCQLVGLGDLTCSDATFEVLADEPVTTTTMLTTTTTVAGPTTTGPSPATTSPAPSTTTTLEQPVTSTPPIVEGSGPTAGGEAVRAAKVVSSSGSGSQGPTPTTESSTTTSTIEEEPVVSGTYTPPTLSGTDTSQPDGEADGPTIVLEAAGDKRSSLSWLDDPLIFWSAWLVAVILGGTLASLTAWLIHRRRSPR